MLFCCVPTPVCTQEPIELGIVLDSSSSIPRKDFRIAKKFLQDFLKQFDIGTGENEVRVSIITYGKGIYPEVGKALYHLYFNNR